VLRSGTAGPRLERSRAVDGESWTSKIDHLSELVTSVEHPQRAMEATVR